MNFFQTLLTDFWEFTYLVEGSNIVNFQKSGNSTP